jgi:hypothetical protein
MNGAVRMLRIPVEQFPNACNLCDRVPRHAQHEDLRIAMAKSITSRPKTSKPSLTKSKSRPTGSSPPSSKSPKKPTSPGSKGRKSIGKSSMSLSTNTGNEDLFQELAKLRGPMEPDPPELEENSP